jgi:hypothetical protein
MNWAQKVEDRLGIPETPHLHSYCRRSRYFAIHIRIVIKENDSTLIAL